MRLWSFRQWTIYSKISINHFHSHIYGTTPARLVSSVNGKARWLIHRRWWEVIFITQRICRFRFACWRWLLSHMKFIKPYFLFPSTQEHWAWTSHAFTDSKTNEISQFVFQTPEIVSISYSWANFIWVIVLPLALPVWPVTQCRATSAPFFRNILTPINASVQRNSLAYLTYASFYVLP